MNNVPKFLKPEIANQLQESNELVELQEAIKDYSPFVQKAAYELFVTSPSQIMNWPKDRRTVFLVIFEDKQIPTVLQDQMRAIKLITDNQSRYPFYFQRAFLIGIFIVFFLYILKGLNQWINANLNSQLSDTSTDKIFGIILTFVPIIILIILLLGRHKTTNSFKELILIRENKLKKERQVQSQNGLKKALSQL